MSKIGRNSPCPCGSGRKYKACCGLAAHPLANRNPVETAREKVDAAWQAIGRQDYGVAEQALSQALELDPASSDAWHLQGIVAFHQGDYSRAAEQVRQAIAISPANPNFYNSLGNMLKASGRNREAIETFRHALALQPAFAQAHYNLALALREDGGMAEAGKLFEQAIRLDPNFAQAHYNLALDLLLQGEMRRGWEEYEWRWLCPSFLPFRRDFRQPLWQGEDLAGRTLLLYSEQGFGDTMQFVRYLPQAAARAGTVIVECHPELYQLLARSFPKVRFVAKGEPLPAFDRQCPLLSLPRIFSTTLQNLPANVPYLQAEPEEVERWRNWLDAKAQGTGGLKVGIVWAGNPQHAKDRLRSMPLSALEPLFQIPGVCWFSLQKGEARGQLAPYAERILDCSEQLTSFSATAALVTGLDLVIAVDTAVAHLAGALNRPVFTLHSWWPDWRWLLERSDSPWYPSMRLFRQEHHEAWAEVAHHLAAEVRALANMGQQ